MINLKEVNHVCATCNFKFKAATLSDFGYGEFLLWTKKGNCNYLNALEDKTFSELSDILKSNSIDKDLLHKMYGIIVCDNDEDDNFYEIGSPPCPSCGSRKISSISEEVLGDVSIPSVSHKLWDSLTQADKVTRSLKSCR